MNFIFSFIISIIIFMVLDGSWITYNYKYYMTLNKKIQTIETGILNIILYGLVIYGTYSFTSCSYYKNYTYYDGLIDTLWGMILFGITGIIFISIYKSPSIRSY